MRRMFARGRHGRCARRRGALITTSGFTDDAQKYVRNLGQKIVLLDGRQLAELMIRYGVGVGNEATYTLKRIDSDYFDLN